MRIQAIINEYAQLNQTNWFDLTLEALPGGSVKVFLSHGKNNKVERVITKDEDLSFISHTFNQSNSITDINFESVKEAHFDTFGYLIVVHENSIEQFKVPSAQKEEIASKIKALVKPLPQPKEKVVSQKQGELLYNYLFTEDGKRTSVIIAGDTLEKVESTALDVLTKRGIDYQKNKVCRERIN